MTGFVVDIRDGVEGIVVRRDQIAGDRRLDVVDLTGRPVSGLRSATDAALDLLTDRAGFDLAMITAFTGVSAVVLRVRDRHFGVRPGATFPWSDTLCARLAHGRGPTLAPDVSRTVEYADAPIVARLGIGAYVGVPLRGHEGRLVGTVCGFHREPVEPWPAEDVTLLRLLARAIPRDRAA